MKYKRLTKRAEDYVFDNCCNCEYDDNPMGCTERVCYEVMKNRLAELEDKIEQGTLIELPCKVGDIVYETEGVRIYEHKIDRIIYVDKMLIYDTNEIMFDERAIGVSVFFTREEAEKRLKELQE